MIGETLGNYRIVEKLGEGGMGVVYVAEHTLIARKAAVKLLLPDFSRNQDIVNRFFNEAKSATSINHSGIIQIFDFGYTPDGAAYIVMEYLDGEVLTDRIHQTNGGMAEGDIIRIVRQTAAALQAAHTVGIVHRDLKPDNIFLVPDPQVIGGERIKILDFGIAKLTDDSGLSGSQTRTGAVMGSPAYMSPEQCRGAGMVDHRSDIYSLGCVMYEMVAGEPPFYGGGTGTMIAKHIYEEPPTLNQRAALSPELEAIIMRALVKDVDQRYQSMTELSKALDGLAAGVQQNYTPLPGPLPVRPPTQRGPTTDPNGPTVMPDHLRASTPVPAMATGPIKSPTTLGNAASEMADDDSELPASSGRARLWMGLVAAAVLMIGGGTALLATGGSKEPSTSAAAAQPATTPVAEAPTTAETTPEPQQPEPVKAALPDKVKITITSDPNQADVYDGDKRVGETPFVSEFPTSRGQLDLVLKRRHYEDRPVHLVLDRDRTEDVELTSTRSRGRDSGRRGDDRNPNRGTDTHTGAAGGDDFVIKDNGRKKKKKDRTWGGTVDPFAE